MDARALRVLLYIAIALPVTAAAGYAPGESTIVIDARGTTIAAFVYKPANFRGEALIVSLHGLGRNAEAYRNHTRALAERFGALLVAPVFDRERFPTWRYQHGGIARRSALGALVLEAPEQWTGEVLRIIIDAVRAEEGAADMPYALLGHSAGGQLLARVAAFGNLRPARIVVANPSSWVVPSAVEPYPYGFGDLPPELGDERAIERYLAQPLTVLLGTADTDSKNLSTASGAVRQGEHRHARGVNVFRAAESIARAKGWRFGWRLIEIPGVGHSARRVYASPLAAAAFCPDGNRSLDHAGEGGSSAWPCARMSQ